ncbi:efflux RND transporter periplasmic adaptor subunit [Clostridium sp.]|uniref:efflux RND transporter periplasmic adaptor subunit n=1 Tax=Clostridium sp. TaxID=1506 RepID=UPI00321649B3
MKEKIKMSSKKKKILIVVGLVAFALLVAGIVIVKLRPAKEKNIVTHEDSYEIQGVERLKFNGVSVISDEQRIIADKSLGEIKDIKINDGQEVKSGDILFSYHNTAIEDQIAQSDRQIASNNDKITKVKNDKAKTNSNISQLESELNNIINELSTVQATAAKSPVAVDENSSNKSSELIKKQTVLEAKQVEIAQKIDILKGQISGADSEITTYEDTNKGLSVEKDILNKKLNSEVVAEIDGVVKIDNKGITDPTTVYMRIISKEPLVKAEASEFDIKSLNVNDEMLLKVVSSGEYVKGSITKIDDLPIEEVGRTVTGYNFYIKPEKSIMVGFSLEVNANYKGIGIPKDYVYEKDSKICVLKEKGDSYENIEIKAISEGDSYYLLDGIVGIGDKLIKNPSKVLEGSN